jgi:hypothetical protein
MRTGLRVYGTGAFAAKLTRFASELGRDLESVVKQEARALAGEYGAATGPGMGMAQTTGDKLKRKIDSDVRRAFASRQNPQAVYRLLSTKSPQLAAAYWHAYKAKKTRRMGQILTQAGLAEGVSSQALRGVRTNGKGGVPKNIEPLSLGREPQVAALSRRQQLLVGTAKAGWHQAAKGLGGRVRRNLTDSDGKRRTEEIFPEYVRKVSNRFSGLGGAFFVGGEKPSATIFSSVRHAVDALISPGAIEQANERAQARFHKALLEALQWRRLRTFKQAA